MQVCVMSNKVRDLCCSEWEACSYYWFSVWRICYDPYWFISISLMCYLVSMTWIAYSHSVWILLIRYRSMWGSWTGRSNVCHDNYFCRFFLCPCDRRIHRFIIVFLNSFSSSKRAICPIPPTSLDLILSVWRVTSYKASHHSFLSILLLLTALRFMSLPPLPQISSVCTLPINWKNKFLIHV